MNNFEVTLLISPDTTKNDHNKVLEDFKKLVTSNDGSIIEKEDWGLRDLTYKINNSKKAFYFYYQINIAGKTIQQLRKVIDEDIRYVSQGVGSNHALNIIKTLNKHNERNPGKEIMFLNHSAVTTSFTNELCNFYHFRFDANVDMKVAGLVTQMANDPDVKKVYYPKPVYYKPYIYKPATTVVIKPNKIYGPKKPNKTYKPYKKPHYKKK